MLFIDYTLSYDTCTLHDKFKTLYNSPVFLTEVSKT